MSYISAMPVVWLWRTCTLEVPLSEWQQYEKRSCFFIFLCFYHHLCNYCNHVFSDQSSNAVCRYLYRGCCHFNMYKTNQLTGNVYNDSEVTVKVKEDIRSCYAKYVFLLGETNNVIVSLVLLGLFTDRNDAFSYPFIYFSYSFVYLKPKKGTPFARSLPIQAIMWSAPHDKKRHR